MTPAVTDKRRRDLAAMHAARRELGMDEDTYRAMLQHVAGTRSAKDLDASSRARVLDHLRKIGWRPRRKGRSRPPADKASLVAKIRAQLAAAERADQYADGIARHMFGIERFDWCTPDQLRRIVAALAYDAKRHGRAAR